MIDNINYTFSKSLDVSLGYDIPFIDIINIAEFPSGCLIDWEISVLTLSYLKEIVKELEEVKARERERSDFGFETTIIHVLKSGYKAPNGNFYPDGHVRISYNYGHDVLETSLSVDDVLKMMTDYRDYIDAWEKETGKIKK